MHDHADLVDVADEEDDRAATGIEDGEAVADHVGGDACAARRRPRSPYASRGPLEPGGAWRLKERPEEFTCVGIEHFGSRKAWKGVPKGMRGQAGRSLSRSLLLTERSSG